MRKNKKVKGYICGITSDHKLGETTCKIYHSIASLKRDHEMWKECGIDEVEIKVTKTIVKQDLFKKEKL